MHCQVRIDSRIVCSKKREKNKEEEKERERQFFGCWLDEIIKSPDSKCYNSIFT